MATASTKRNRKRARDDSGAASPSRGREEEVPRKGAVVPPVTASDLPERVWLYASAAILLLALALRLYALDMKPLHHDEGVNGFFLTNLLRQGRYVYDPENYHGPTLYYLTLPFVALAGLHTFVLRLVPSLFGVGVVWLVLTLRRQVGTVAALAAALLLAVSPACVIYSRYFIHEMPFVFFTLGLVVSALRFRETGAASDLLLAAAAAAMMFATKETAFISVGTLGLAWLTAALW
ncbi:MAG TPA: flippase activity-associated protein Agl23, partial [Pyrinomonadaceae bacterium]